MNRPVCQPRMTETERFAPEVRHGLEQLLQATDYAQDLDSSLWEFAVEIERLLALGMTTSDLRWLVKRGYLSHAREITTREDTDRRFEPAEQNVAFAQNTCFVLAEAGLAALGREFFLPHPALVEMPIEMPIEMPVVVAGSLVGQAALEGQTDFPGPVVAGSLADRAFRGAAHGVGPAAVPNWDRDTRTFLVGEYLVKRFRVPSPNQEAVLDAFQEEGWPRAIDDPLPPVADQLPKYRLRNTIKCLNTNQATRLIHFCGDGTGQRVLWELSAEAVSHAGFAGRPILRRAA